MMRRSSHLDNNSWHFANLGIFVHPDYEYAEVKTDKVLFVVAKELVNSLAETLGWESVEVVKKNSVELNWNMQQHGIHSTNVNH